jgi:hypothetical protein
LWRPGGRGGGGGGGGGGGSAIAQRQRQLGGGAMAVAVSVAAAQQCDGGGSFAEAWRRHWRQAMDGVRARVIDGVTATLRRRNARW